MELYDVNEFWKFDLRVGLVKKAEKLKRTKKLIKLEVDFGSEQRTIITGLADQYSPEDLEGKKLIFVLNLKPKKLSGIESQGMLIVAESEDGKVYLLPVPDEVPIGTKVW
ncbi:methionine--tRNA ligase subunit beta [Thermococcus sp. MV5]|uniref:methionine--tRNA ligase subunit beta n=1 Tax=unclassified Thermococcus TaxID=2627626 RepID=UPI0006DA5452|nr:MULTISPECIES: methionine--tRNA ligase subunit beta [unclassified Thermococcus]KPU63478.1 tRNA-binding protein [Thermococcus sp. EP1]NJE26883.1 methionine--tRNA ligase subunit beta [Thermococcus sp. MV5]